MPTQVLAGALHGLRLNGWSRAKSAIGEFLPSLSYLTVIPAAPTHPVHAEVARAWHALPQAVAGAKGVLSPFFVDAPTTAPPPSTIKAAVVASQHKLSAALSCMQRSVVRTGLSPLGRLLWERAADKGAKHWLNTTPLYASRRLSSDEYRVAACLWLHGDIAELVGTADPSGRSLMRADRAGRIYRHHGVARTYADLCIEAGNRVWTEAAVFPEFTDAMSTAARGGVERGSSRRIDVLATPMGGLTGHAIDPRVLDPGSPALLERWAASSDSPCPLEAAEHVKLVHYADLPLAWTLRPCGHGTQGDMGPGAHACANALALQLATRRSGGITPTRDYVDVVRREVYGRLGVSLMRELANQIIATFGGNPRAGLTKTNAYVHSAFRAGGIGARSLATSCICADGDAARVGCVCNAPPGAGEARRRG